VVTPKSTIGMRRSVKVAGLRRVNMGEKGMEQETIVHLALNFEEISRRLKAFLRAVQELASREGHALTQAVAEHVLACYRSRDPTFLLESVR
jgi:chromosomal replication initiation ATPase DnaA